MSAPPATPEEQVAEWLVRLGSDDPDERQRAAAGFLAWKEANPLHADAAARLEGLLDGIEGIRRSGTVAPAREAIRVGRHPRRRSLCTCAAALVLAGVLLVSGWQQRQLVVHKQPLAAVLDALARRHPGRIHYDRAAIAGLRVSAVMPLDDTDRALRLVTHDFPGLRIRVVGPDLVIVDRKKK